MNLRHFHDNDDDDDIHNTEFQLKTAIYSRCHGSGGQSPTFHLKRPEVEPRTVRVRFMSEEVAMRQVSLRVL